jgi:hypothetical protein
MSLQMDVIVLRFVQLRFLQCGLLFVVTERLNGIGAQHADIDLRAMHTHCMLHPDEDAQLLG